MADNTRNLVVVRHRGKYLLGVPPVKMGGTVAFNSSVQVQFQESSPLTPSGPASSFTATGEPGRYWFGFDGQNFPYCVEICQAPEALDTVHFNLHIEEDQKELRIKLHFDATPGRILNIARENLDDGKSFEVDLVLSNNQRFPLGANDGTDIWNLDAVTGSLQIRVEAPPGGGLLPSPLPNRVQQVVGGEMADIEIG